jgi:hypothetical protein
MIKRGDERRELTFGSIRCALNGRGDGAEDGSRDEGGEGGEDGSSGGLSEVRVKEGGDAFIM